MTAEQKARIAMLRRGMLFDELSDEEANEYWELSALEDEEYRVENEPKLHEYYNKYIKGKTGRELDCSEEWGFYSDWHKDVYGYRPRLELNEIA